MNILNRKDWVAIIGSRNASKEELKAAYNYAIKMADEGKVVVSGLALGIDASAHQGALDVGGKTIAIVNTPIDQPIYPKQNRILAEEIKKAGIIFHPYATPAEEEGKGLKQFSKRLIERDVLLARLCPVIVAVKNEDSPFTGGTRYGVHFGKYYNQEVYRLDCAGNLHKNPETAKADIWWKMEIDIENKVKKLDQLFQSQKER